MFFGVFLGLPFMLLTFGSVWILLRGLKFGKRFYDKSIITGSLGLLVVILVASQCGGYIGYTGSLAMPFVLLQTLAAFLAAAMVWHDAYGRPYGRQKLIFLFLVLFLPIVCFCGIVFQNNQSDDEDAKIEVSASLKWIDFYFHLHNTYPASLNELSNDAHDTDQEINGRERYPDDQDYRLRTLGDESWLYQKTTTGFVVGYWYYPADFLTGYHFSHHSFPAILGPRVCIYTSASATYECGLNRWGPFPRPPNAK